MIALLQILRWLQVHGLTFEGLRCVKAGCEGVFRLATRKRKHKDKETEEMLLRCDSCKQEKTARGEFFSCYKTANLHETFQMLYGVAERWRPDQLRQELNIRDRTRIVAMLDNVGKICQFYLELFFKHSLGRWELLGVDEAATGQAKKPAPEKQSNQQRKVCGGGCQYSSTRKILMALHVDVRVSSSNRSQNWSGWTAGLGCKNVKSGHLNI